MEFLVFTNSKARKARQNSARGNILGESIFKSKKCFNTLLLMKSQEPSLSLKHKTRKVIKREKVFKI